MLEDWRKEYPLVEEKLLVEVDVPELLETAGMKGAT